MKKWIVPVLLGALIAPVGSVYAKGGYGMAGCGLGSLLITKNSNGMQMLASTTNGTFGNQTFGITSGTLNCTKDGAMKAEAEQIFFAEVNMRHLSRNMAEGQGEFLGAFAELLGCEQSAQPTLFELTQSKYESLFPRPDTAPAEMLSALKGEMRAHPSLSGSCSRI